MSFYDEARNVPRDAGAIERHAWNGADLPSAWILLLAVAIVFGLFYLGTQFVPARTADTNAGPSMTQPVSPVPSPNTPEETRPTQAPIR